MWKFIKSKNDPGARWLILSIALTLVLAILLGLQAVAIGHGFSDPDVFYHARMAQLLWSNGFSFSGGPAFSAALPSINHFPWLPFTTLAHHFADLHLLFHLLLAPFAHHLTAMPWVTASLSFIMFAVFALLMHNLKIKFMPLWLILLCLVSADFLYRISILKINTLSLIFLFLAILTVHQRRYVWLFILSFLYVFTYGGFILLPGIILIYTLVRLASKKLDFIPLLVACSATLIAILAFPHPAELLRHLYYQTAGVITTLHHSIPLGQEWFPYDSLKEFIRINNLTLIMWIGAAVLLWRNIRAKALAGHDRDYAIWFGIVSLIFFAGTVWSKRFVEYWVPFTVLFAAYSFSGLDDVNLNNVSWTHLKASLSKFWELRAAMLIAFFVVAGLGIYNISTTVRYLKDATPFTAFAGASQWLAENSRQGDIVFNTQWDAFPQLFYYNDKNYYIAGLDPTFLYAQNPALYAKWRVVSDDDPTQWHQDTAQLKQIMDDFKAKYIFLEPNRNPNLKEFLDLNSQDFPPVYSDSATAIYKINWPLNEP